MSSAIAPADEAGTSLVSAGAEIAALQQNSMFGQDDFKGVAGAGVNFLPRLQLYTSNSDLVKSGKIPLTHYGVVKGKDTLFDLGKTVVMIPLAWRAKAMDVKAEPNPLAYFDQKSPEFMKIVEIANADSNQGKMFGPEFLVWIDTHGYCTFFFGSKSARNVAPALKALLPKANGQLQVAAATSKYIEGKEYKWHAPEISPSAQTLASMPPPETIYPTVSEFLNPKASEQEPAKEAAPPDAAAPDR